MKKKLIFLFWFIIQIFSCSKNDDQFWFLDKDIDYNRVKTEFKDYISFFPKSNQATSKIVTWSIDKETEYNLKVIFSFSENELNNILKNVKKKSIANYSPTDDCLLVLNRFDTHENYGAPEIKTELIDLPCYNNLYPIPNFSVFSDYQTNKNSCKLKDDFEIFVLEAQSGFFLEQDKLTKGKYMPPKWKNGYSKGISISKIRKLAIYWVIIW